MKQTYVNMIKISGLHEDLNKVTEYWLQNSLFSNADWYYIQSIMIIQTIISSETTMNYSKYNIRLTDDYIQ